MTPFLLQDLASDKSVLVRREVAKNARTPTPALAKLAAEDDRWLREAVAHNPSSSVETLEILASDHFAKVRMAVIDNSSCPEPLRLSTFRGLLSEGDADLIGVMAGEINPVPFYEALKDPLAPVRAIVARYQATPTQLLEILAKERSAAVRAYVAGNPSTPTTLVETLSKDDWASVRANVAGNRSTPTDLL